MLRHRVVVAHVSRPDGSHRRHRLNGADIREKLTEREKRNARRCDNQSNRSQRAHTPPNDAVTFSRES
jgi:hypothetical protein